MSEPGSIVFGGVVVDTALKPVTWADQIAKDSSAQLGKTAGGMLCNYKPDGQSDFYVWGIFKRVSVAIDVETARETYKTVLIVATTDIPRSAQGDKVTVDEREYFVIGNNPDGTGATTLTLSLDSNV